jgi:hypothetical protein
MRKKRLLAASRESMTLPDERYRAVRQTRLFLQDLITPGKIPRVPRSVREAARGLLRHYPGDYDMYQVCQAAPGVFQERMDDLHRFIRQGIDQRDRGSDRDPEVSQPHPGKD